MTCKLYVNEGDSSFEQSYIILANSLCCIIIYYNYIVLNTSQHEHDLDLQSVNFARQDKVYHIDSDYQAILFKST